MRLTKEAQYLLDRYMLSCSRRLPLRQKKEITEELRSSILDEIEARCPEDEITEDMVKSILVEFGAPQKLASSYGKDQYVIGPKAFPLFRMIFLIVAIVVSAVGIINIGISMSSWDIVGILKELGMLLSSLFTALGTMVVVFWIIERAAAPVDWNEELYDDWKLSDLPEIETRTPVKLWEQITSIIFALILIIGLNLFGERIGGCFTADGTCVVIPVLKEGFYDLLPFLTFRWLLTIVFASLLIWKRKETLALSIFSIVLSCLDIAISFIFLRGGFSRFFEVDALAVTALEPALPVFRVMYYALFIFLIAITVWEIIKKVIELFKFPVIE